MAGNAQRAGPPFSHDEKNYLLAEIIKSASIHPQHLLNVVIQNNLQPRWEDMPLPPGRSLNACRFAFEELRRSSGYSPQTPLSAPLSGALKRPWQAEQPPPAGPREIRPKTDLGPGMQLLPQTSRPQDSGARKKRGRPTKLEQEARQKAQLAAAATGGASEASFGPRLPLPPQLPAVAPAIATSPARASLPPPPRMPISTMITPTAQKTTSNSSSSSGKRRRGKSLRLEQPEPIAQVGAGASASQYQAPLYQSPYGTIQADDTPARTAATRHRDEASIASAPPSAGSAQFSDIAREPGPAPDSGREPSVGYYQPHRPDSRPS